MIALEHGGQGAAITVISKYTFNTPGSKNLDHRLKKDADQLGPEAEVEAGVAGGAAQLTDYDAITRERIPLVVIAITLITLLMMIIIVRAPLLATLAVALNLATVGVAFGVIVLLFNVPDGYPGGGHTYVDAIGAVAMFGVVFGLSIDYAVFLLMRMKESYDRDGDNAAAISDGLEKTARVITGAAAIMMAVFIAFAAAPIATVSQLGIGLTIAVLLDATVVRIVLLPALMLLLGDRVWHVPKWLDRILPELNVEGESHEGPTAVVIGGPATEGERQPSAARRLLEAGAELGEELGVVPRGDDRVGEFAGEELQLLQGAAVVVGVGGARRQRRVAAQLGLHVGGVAADHEVALLEAGDHRDVAGRVPGRVGEPDRAVAEEVEGAPEGRVGVDLAAVEVDRPVVEGVVVVHVAVAVQRSAAAPWVAACHSASLSTKVESGNSEIAEVWSRCMWVITTIGTSLGVEPLLAQLRRDVGPGLEARVAEAGRRGGRSSRRRRWRPRGAGRCRRGSRRRSGGGSGRRGRGP